MEGTLSVFRARTLLAALTLGLGACDPDLEPDDDCYFLDCEEERNACGGFRVLDGTPGDYCGTCDDGVWECEGTDAVYCTATPEEECTTTCEALEGLEDYVCGVCDDSRYECDEFGQLECVETVNDCGGCTVLEALPGESCGCGGTYECGGTDYVTCFESGDPTACEDCQAYEGTSCGACDSGRITCDEYGNQVCEGEITETNACGGCSVLSDERYATCGACGEGYFDCADSESLYCSGEGSAFVNECGGCEELPGVPGESCGDCGGGIWECTSEGTLRCGDDPTPTNDCGGCGILDVTLGADCGTCGKGTWQCNGLQAVVCASDTGNACGGCQALAHKPGDACGPCGQDQYVCDGAEGVKCSGETFGNTCGGCNSLGHAAGDACDGDDTDRCSDDKYECQGKEQLACTSGTAQCQSEPCKLDTINITDETSDTSWIAATGCNAAGTVYVSGDKVKNLEFLGGLTKIDSLKVMYTPNLSSLNGLRNVRELNFLTLTMTPALKSLEGLGNLEKLLVLHIGSEAGTCGRADGCPASFREGGLESLDGLAPQTSLAGITIMQQASLRSLGAANNLTFGRGADFRLLENPVLEDISAVRFTEGELAGLLIDTNPKLRAVEMPLATSAAAVIRVANNATLETVRADKAKTLGARVVDNNPQLRTLRLDSLASVSASFVVQKTGLTSLGIGRALRTLGGLVYIMDNPELLEIDALVDVRELKSTLFIKRNPKLEGLAGLSSVRRVGKDLSIEDNGIKNLNALSQLTTVAGTLSLLSNKSLESIAGLSHLTLVTGDLQIQDNPKLPTCRGHQLVEQLQKVNGLRGTATVSGNGASDDCL